MALTKAQAQALGWVFEIDNGVHCLAGWMPLQFQDRKGPYVRGATGSGAQANVLEKITAWDNLRNRFVTGHIKIK